MGGTAYRLKSKSYLDTVQSFQSFCPTFFCALVQNLTVTYYCDLTFHLAFCLTFPDHACDLLVTLLLTYKWNIMMLYTILISFQSKSENDITIVM